MTDFDPWTATNEEAIAAQSEWDQSPRGRAPLFQWAGARGVDSRRAAVDAGDGFAVLACIRTCVTNDLVAPEWLAYAFNRHYDQVLSCRVGSWDEAFGKPYPGKHLRSLRQRRELRFAVLNRVNALIGSAYEIGDDGDWHRVPNVPVDVALFERVGAELGIGKTLCAELYYEAVRPTSAK